VPQQRADLLRKLSRIQSVAMRIRVVAFALSALGTLDVPRTTMLQCYEFMLRRACAGGCAIVY
jgi:hypothetical protein